MHLLFVGNNNTNFQREAQGIYTTQRMGNWDIFWDMHRWTGPAIIREGQWFPWN